MPAYKIIYIGPVYNGNTCSQRQMALAALGCDIFTINTRSPRLHPPTLIKRALHKILGPKDTLGVNQQILAAIPNFKPDILWIDKGLVIRPETLISAKKLYPQVKLVSYSPDDMFNPNNQTSFYKRCIPLYDVHITTKSYNVAEFEHAGAQKVIFIDNAFCEFTHKPPIVSDAEREHFGGPVGFIGTYEKQRAKSLRVIADAGIKVKIWGEWPASFRHPNLEIMHQSLLAEDYAKAIYSFDINLCFLRKENRDLQTTRSMEIPACGGFMLAERTTEHLRLFEEGKEADYFSDNEELLRKIRLYLANPRKRLSVALAGREKCISAGYSNTARLGKTLKLILEA